MIWSTISTTWWHRFYIFKLCSFKTIGSRLARAGLLQHWKTRTKEIPSDPGYCVFYITQTKPTLIIQTKPNFALSTIPFQYCQSTDKCCCHLQIINFKLKHAHGNQKWVKGQKKLLEHVQAPFSFGLRMAKRECFQECWFQYSLYNLVLPCRIGKETGIILSDVWRKQRVID